jgi:hypothetical protein
MPLGNPYAGMTEKGLHVLDWGAVQQELDSKGIAEPVRVSAFHLGRRE